MISLTPRRLIANASCNTAAYLVSLVAAFVLTPIVLRSLGQERYGAWSFVESFVAYLTLFDLGVAAALVRFVPKHVMAGDFVRLNRVYSASLTFFAGGAVIALSVGSFFDWFFLNCVLPSDNYANEIRWLFRLLVFNFAVSLPMSVYPAILDGLGRFIFKSTVRMAMVILRIPLTVHALQHERRLMALGIVITACQLVEYTILTIGAQIILPQLRFHPRQVDRRTIRDVAGYSWSAFVAMMAGRLSFHTDALVIGPILGPAAITLFAVPAQLVERARTGLRQATTTLTGAFSAFESAGEHDKLRQTYLAGSQAAWMVALPVTIGLVCLGPSFLQLWIGPEYRTTFVLVLWVLAPLVALTIAQSVASRVLYGIGDLKSFATAATVEGIANLTLSVALIYPFGVVGVAIGTAVPHACFCFWVIVYVCRKLNVSFNTYLKSFQLSRVALVAPTALWAWQGYWGMPTWTAFLAIGFFGVGLYGVALLFPTGHWRRFIKPIGKSAAVLVPWRRVG